MAVESLLPQVDRMFVYLNGYPKVPDYLKNEKVAHALLSCDAGWRGSEAKFFFADPDSYKATLAPTTDDVYFTCDDDIVYPRDYVVKMVAALNRHPGAVVCVHGSVLDLPVERYKKRTIFRFAEPLAQDQRVHIPGSGTLAYRLRDFVLRLKELEIRTEDPNIGVILRERGIPLFSVARPPDWLKEIERPAVGSTLWSETVGSNNDKAETTIVKRVDWPRLPVHAKRSRRSRPVPLRKAGEPSEEPKPGPVKFALIAPGWNCAGEMEKCFASIAEQEPGGYTYRVLAVSDGSDDGTERVAEVGAGFGFPFEGFHYEENRGAALRRWELLQKLAPDEIAVLIDLDDFLLKGALRRIASAYRGKEGGPRIKATFGNWRDRRRGNPFKFYPASVQKSRAYRRQPTFLAAPPRTFRAELLAKVVPETHLQKDGEWLRCCTDAALSFPILEQCAPGEIQWIGEPLYYYNSRRSTGTIARFGQQKKEVMAYLATLPPLDGRT